jgi:uncharacterized Zn finger protein
MARFKVIVQVYKEFEVEAPSQLDAMRMADEKMKESGTTDRYNVNHAKNLDKPKKAKKTVTEGQPSAPETPTQA